MHPLIHNVLATLISLPVFIVRPYTSPRDSRWQSTQRYAPILLLPITIAFVTTWLLFGIAFGQSRTLSDEYDAQWARFRDSLRPGNERGPYPTADYPPIRWKGEGQDAAGLFFLWTFALLLDMINIPLSHMLFHRDHLHPVYALTSSIFLAPAYFTAASLGLFIQLVDENPPETPRGREWVRLMTAVWAFEYALGVMYFVYMGYAACAVHRWRAEKKTWEKIELKGVVTSNKRKDDQEWVENTV